MKKDTAAKTAIHLIVLTVIIGFLFWQLNNRPARFYESPHRVVMGTIARMMVVADREKQSQLAIRAAFETIDRIEAMMSDYRDESQLSQLNQSAFDRPIQVNNELFYVISQAVAYSEQTGGAFDVTVGPIVQLWRNARKTGTTPTPGQIAACKSKVGWQNLILDEQNQTVRFKKKGMYIDLGGIAKGYAIDQAIEVLKAHGLTGGMVDIGGDIRCFGTPANHAPYWYIGLQDPRRPDNTTLRFQVKDLAVATSGDYQRFVMIGQTRHSHIIDPQKADSADELSSVSIIAPTAIKADALATAVSVMGHEKGLELIETLPNVQAVTLSSAQPDAIRTTAGAETYIAED